MKVLFKNRVDAFDKPGGDVIQMLKIKEFLEKRGCEIEISLKFDDDLSPYDVVHIFNTVRIHESYYHAVAAKRHGKPVALSTIYWNFEEFEKLGRTGVLSFINLLAGSNAREYSKCLYRYLIIGEKNPAVRLFLKKGYSIQQNDIFNFVDMILPNSYAELLMLRKDFDAAGSVPYKIVHNCADVSFYNASPDSFIEKYGLKDVVLCAGIIAPRKNQLALAKALKGTGLKLILVGRVQSESYFDAVKNASDGNLCYIGALDQNQLASAYAAARVHVQPSWLETPGLASLEAALAGGKIVVTNRGSTREYFKDMVYYCDPSDYKSIRAAVVAAYNATPNNLLRDYIKENFTWDKAAEITLDAYHWLLGGGE